MKFWPIFSEPYPCDASARKSVIIILSFSFFVFLFLFLFQPFGLHNLELKSRFFITIGYGLTCALAIALNYFVAVPIFPEFFDESNWTVGRQILWVCWILLTVSLLNSAYSSIANIFSFSMYQVIKASGQVLMVGIFPICILVMFDYLRLFRKHAKKAEQVNQSITKRFKPQKNILVLTSDNENQRLRLTLDELLYMTSADNYVSVVYKSDNSLKKTLLRGTLKQFEQTVEHSFVRRCHRSFIVNLLHFIKITGNAQGYSIKLRGTDSAIPVSRSYADDIISQIEQL